jgi:hypothetical protein
MLRRMLDARSLVAIIVAAGVGVWGLSTYPLQRDNVFLESLNLTAAIKNIARAGGDDFRDTTVARCAAGGRVARGRHVPAVRGDRTGPDHSEVHPPLQPGRLHHAGAALGRGSGSPLRGHQDAPERAQAPTRVDDRPNSSHTNRSTQHRAITTSILRLASTLSKVLRFASTPFGAHDLDRLSSSRGPAFT